MKINAAAAIKTATKIVQVEMLTISNLTVMMIIMMIIVMMMKRIVVLPIFNVQTD